MTSDMINPVLYKVVRKSTIPVDYEVFATDICRKIARQLAKCFRVELDKDVVRRVLAKHYRSDGP